MYRFSQISFADCPSVKARRHVLLTLLLLLLLMSVMGSQPVTAQGTIYTWVDEKGVTHFSNSMAPPQHTQESSSAVTSHPSARTGGAYEVGAIPLVILHNDPSQKFVHAVLEGSHNARKALMLVDTGAQITVLDEETARELDIEHVQDALLAGVTGTSRGWIGLLPTLRVGEEEVNNLHVMVGPMAGRLLLGMDVLEHLGLSVGLRSLQHAGR